MYPLKVGDRVVLKKGSTVGRIEEIEYVNQAALVYWGKDREMTALIWERLKDLEVFTEKCLNPEEVEKRQAPDKLTTVVEDA